MTKVALPALLLSLVAAKAGALSLTDMKFTALPGDVTEVRLQFDSAPPKSQATASNSLRVSPLICQKQPAR